MIRGSDPAQSVRLPYWGNGSSKTPLLGTFPGTFPGYLTQIPAPVVGAGDSHNQHVIPREGCVGGWVGGGGGGGGCYRISVPSFLTILSF